MKRLSSMLLALLLALGFFFGVQAQAQESVWLTAAVSSFRPGDKVTVTVNALTGTPIQGFNIQVRYDPACLSPVDTTTPIPGMNLLALPQEPGLVDSTFASTTPQTANGVLADVHFTALAECQTSLTLEKADLAVKSPEGFAIPLVGITMGQQTIPVAVGPGAPVTPAPAATQAPSTGFSIPAWAVIVLVVLGILIVFVLYKLLRSMPKGRSE
jgi:hypothetical protein